MLFAAIKLSTEDEFKAWQQETRLLNLLSDKGTLDVSQVSDILDKPLEDIKPIIARLEKQKLIKSEVGNYYHLTFEGERQVRNLKAIERTRSQQR